MQILLTSFGLSHLPWKSDKPRDFFDRRPPLSISLMHHQGVFPDYALLLLCDRVIMDQSAYDQLQGDAGFWGYRDAAELFRLLNNEGLVQLEDFSAVIDRNRGLLDRMLLSDLRRLDTWVPALKESYAIWSSFAASPYDYDGFWNAMRRHRIRSKAFDDLRVAMGVRHSYWLCMSGRGPEGTYKLVDEALESSAKRRRKEHRAALRREMQECLAYVNTNLILADALGASIHDWEDFGPFYREKFLAVGRDSLPGEDKIQSVRKLFDVSFPEFALWKPSSVIRALKDKRLDQLRALVDQASQGELVFDSEFARRTLSEVLSIEKGIGVLRSIVSYVTCPLGLIPGVGTLAQKMTEEAIVAVAARRKRADKQWFYMLSELATHTVCNSGSDG